MFLAAGGWGQSLSSSQLYLQPLVQSRCSINISKWIMSSFRNSRKLSTLKQDIFSILGDQTSKRKDMNRIATQQWAAFYNRGRGRSLKSMKKGARTTIWEMEGVDHTFSLFYPSHPLLPWIQVCRAAVWMLWEQTGKGWKSHLWTWITYWSSWTGRRRSPFSDKLNLACCRTSQVKYS